jgi:maltose O-acetyltransferase
VRGANVLLNDLRGTRPLLGLVQLLAWAVPRLSFGWLRPWLYRAAGVRIGPGTRIYGPMQMEGVGDVSSHLTVGSACMFTTPLFLNLSGRIEIGNDVVIGHHVAIVTDDHQIGGPQRRCGERIAKPVKIEDGAWIGARATVLPGTIVGRGSVVAAGALVNRDVPANTLVGGVPARVIKVLPT